MGTNVQSRMLFISCLIKLSEGGKSAHLIGFTICIHPKGLKFTVVTALYHSLFSMQVIHCFSHGLLSSVMNGSLQPEGLVTIKRLMMFKRRENHTYQTS